MRRIKFDKETIDAIRTFLEQEKHTVAQTANRFGVSEDTIRRVMHENNISPGHPEKRTGHIRSITEENVSEIVHMFKDTDISMQDLCKSVKLEYYVVLEILKVNFTEEGIKQRKSRRYKNSKLGDNNPMFGKRGEETYNWKGGIVSDGQGYLIIKKPDWYTGRVRSDYVFYHSVVMCEALGITEIPAGFSVHHIDHNPLNNNINNLALVSMGAHSRLHAIEKKMCKVQRLSIPGVDDDEEFVETPDTSSSLLEIAADEDS